MAEPVRCAACHRPFNAKLSKCPFCNAPNGAAAQAPAAGPGSPARAAPPPSGPAPAFDFAAAALKAIETTRPFMPLEFHPAAVTALDLFFEHNWGTEGEAPHDERWLIPAGKQNVIVMLGSFFGELLRREFGGRWVADPANPGNPLNAGVLMASGVQAFPLAKVYKRLKNGAEDGLEPLYAWVRNAAPKPVSAPDLEGWKRFARHFEGVGRAELAVPFYEHALALSPSPALRTALEAMRAAAVAAAAASAAQVKASGPSPGLDAPHAVAKPPLPTTPKPLSASAQALASAAARLSELADAGQHQALLAACDELLALSPARAEALVGKARALLGLRRAKDALEWVDDFPPGRDLDPARALLRAAAAEALEDKVKAEEAYRAALTSKNLSAEDRTRAAARAEALGHEPEVIQARLDALPNVDDVFAGYEKLTASHPDYAEAWCERGAGLAVRNQLDQAFFCFDRAIAANPTLETSYDHKAVTLMRLKRFDEALATLDLGLGHCPASGQLHCRRGICVTLAGKAAAAVSDFDRSLEVAPDHFEAWAYKGDAEAKSEQREKAITSLERYLTLCKGSQNKLSVAVRRQLWVLKNPGRQTDPDRGQQLQQDAFAAAQRGMQDVALKRLDEAVQADPMSAELWFNRAACLQKLSRFEEAIASYQQSESIAGGAGLGIDGQVACLLHLGRGDEALACHERMIGSTQKPNPADLLAKARTLRRLRRHADAVPLYERLVRKNATDVSLVTERAEMLAEAGLVREARFAFDAALELSGGNAKLEAARARVVAVDLPDVRP